MEGKSTSIRQSFYGDIVGRPSLKPEKSQERILREITNALDKYYKSAPLSAIIPKNELKQIVKDWLIEKREGWNPVRSLSQWISPPSYKTSSTLRDYVRKDLDRAIALDYPEQEESSSFAIQRHKTKTFTDRVLVGLVLLSKFAPPEMSPKIAITKEKTRPTVQGKASPKAERSFSTKAKAYTGSSAALCTVALKTAGASTLQATVLCSPLMFTRVHAKPTPSVEEASYFEPKKESESCSLKPEPHKKESKNDPVFKDQDLNRKLKIVRDAVEAGDTSPVISEMGKDLLMKTIHLQAGAKTQKRTDLIKELINAGFSTIGDHKKGDTPLHAAVKIGSSEIVSLLLEKGAHPIGDQYWGSPLLIAIYYEEIEIIKLFVKKLSPDELGNVLENHGLAGLECLKKAEAPIDIEYGNPKRTLLEYYVLENHSIELAHLLSLGATKHINKVIVSSGLTPLQHAIKQQHIPTINYLLYYGASPSLNSPGENRTAAELAIETGDESVIQSFVAHYPTLIHDLSNSIFHLKQYISFQNTIVAHARNADVTGVIMAFRRGFQLDNTVLRELTQNLEPDALGRVYQELYKKQADLSQCDLSDIADFLKKAWHISEFSVSHVDSFFKLASICPYKKDRDGYDLIAHAVKTGNHQLVSYLIELGAGVAQPYPNKEDAGNNVESLLDLAVKVNDAKMIKRLAQKGAPLNAVDTYGNSALMNAVEQGQLNAVTALLELGADQYMVNGQGFTIPLLALQHCPDKIGDLKSAGIDFESEIRCESAKVAAHSEGTTPLWEMVRHNDFEGVEALLNSHATEKIDRMEARTKATPLGLAVSKGYTKIALRLLEYGASPIARTEYGGFTGNILHLAIVKGDDVVVQHLLERPDIDQLLLTTNSDGDAPLHLAVQNVMKNKNDLNSQTILRLLHENPMAMAIKNKEGKTAAELTGIEQDPELNAFFNADSSTSVFKTRDEHIRSLIQAGKLDDTKNAMKFGMKLSKETALELTRFDDALIYPLIEKEIDLSNAEPSIIRWFLMRLETRNIEKIDQFLVATKVNINATQTTTGDTLLSYAIREGRDDFVRIYIKHGASVNQKIKPPNAPDEIYPPLDIAAGYGYLEIVKTLVDAHANIDTRNHVGATPIMSALRNKQYHVAELLLDLGADLNKVDQHGNTVAHEAALNLPETMEMLQKIYAKGISASIKNKEGESPESLTVIRLKELDVISTKTRYNDDYSTGSNNDPFNLFIRYYSHVIGFISLVWISMKTRSIERRKNALELENNALKHMLRVNYNTTRKLNVTPKASRLDSAVTYNKLLTTCIVLEIKLEEEYEPPELFTCQEMGGIMVDPVVMDGGQTVDLDSFNIWERRSSENWKNRNQGTHGDYEFTNPYTGAPFPSIGMVSGETKVTHFFPKLSKNLALREQIDEWCKKQVPRLKEKIAAITIQRAYRHRKSLS